jgi:hypothetical protein
MKKNYLALVIAFTLTLPVVAQQCQPGQWCTPQPQYNNDAMDNLRRQQAEAQAAQERRMEDLRDQARRQAEQQRAEQPTCTTYHRDPYTGTVTAVTKPCY